MLALFVSGGGWFFAQKQYDRVHTQKAVMFEVRPGASYRKVGQDLVAAGIIDDETWWRLYPKLRKEPLGPKAGRHEIPAGANIERIIEVLADNPLADEVDLTFVEGWRLRDADKAYAAKGLIEAGAYLEAANDLKRFEVPFPLEGAANLEGYLYPETYRVPEGKLEPELLIRRQIQAFDEKFYQPYKDELAKSGRTLRQVVIMASLLEREEPKPSLRPKVAGVLYKRLDADTPLGVDATSRFTLDKWNERKPFLRKLRDPNDPYNTRLKAGLPPGPIGAPSLPSLLAAMRAQPSPYWYYLHDKDGNIHFARSAAEHEANRKRHNVY